MFRLISELPQINHIPEGRGGGTSDTVGNVASATGDTLGLSKEAQKVQRNFDFWCEKNSDYGGLEAIKKNVKITNEGIQITTESEGVQTLYWSGHIDGEIDPQDKEALKKQPYTIAQIGAMIQALGGNELKLRVGHQIGGSKISSFLNEIANIKKGRFYCASLNNNGDTWGIGVLESSVSLCTIERFHINSGFSCQNLK